MAKCASRRGFRTLDQSAPSILRFSACCCDADPPLPVVPTILLGKGGSSTADAIARGSLTETALLSLVLIVLMEGPGNVMVRCWVVCVCGKREGLHTDQRKEFDSTTWGMVPMSVWIFGGAKVRIRT